MEDQDGSVLAGEIFRGDALDVSRGDGLEQGRVGVDRFPAPVGIPEQQLQHEGEAASELAELAGGTLVFHLLQLARAYVLLLELLENRLQGPLDLLRGVALGGGRGDLEVAFVFAPFLSSSGRGRDLPVEHQGLVEPPRSSVQDVLQDDQRRLVDMPVGHRMVAQPHLRLGLGIAGHLFFRQLLDFDRAHRRRRFGAPLKPAEIFFRQLPGLLRFKVAHQAGGEVVRGVIDSVERHRLLSGDPLHVARPADHRPAVGGGAPEESVELLLEFTRGGALHSQPALLADHVPFGVELAEDRVQEPVGLHPEPQLELVGRYVHEVDREIVGGSGVHSGGAVTLVDLVELVLDDVGLLGLEELLEFFSQLLVVGGADLRVARVGDLAYAQPAGERLLFLLHLALDGIEPGESLQVLVDVGGAYRAGPLEHHVLEEVGDAGDPGALIYRTDLGDPAGRDVGVAPAGNHEHLQAVLECMYFDVDVLCRCCRGAREQSGAEKEYASVHGLPLVAAFRYGNQRAYCTQ